MTQETKEDCSCSKNKSDSGSSDGSCFLFGISIDGEHYDVGCSCDGIEVTPSR